MAEVLTEELSFGRYKYGTGTDGSQVRKLIWIDEGSPPPPSATPLAVSDFKNGTYEINEVAKVYADLWGAPSGSGLITPATGFVISANGIDSSEIVGTAALNTALNLPTGITVVIEGVYSAAADRGAKTVVYVDNNPSFTDAWFGDLEATSTTLNSNLSDFGAVNQTDPWTGNVGPHIVAFSLSATALAASVDGATEVTTGAAQANADASTVYAQVRTGAGTGVSTAVIEKITFYALQAPEDLPDFSV